MLIAPKSNILNIPLDISKLFMLSSYFIHLIIISSTKAATSRTGNKLSIFILWVNCMLLIIIIKSSYTGCFITSVCKEDKLTNRTWDIIIYIINNFINYLIVNYYVSFWDLSLCYWNSNFTISPTFRKIYFGIIRARCFFFWFRVILFPLNKFGDI